MTPADKRFWSKVKKTDSCWEWIGDKDKNGYGRFRLPMKSVRAHRHSWFLASGTEPSLLICHKCDNPSCVRPDHLFEGTARDNTADMMAKGRYKSPMAGKTHCPKGHEYSGHNLMVERFMKGGDQKSRRHCRACHMPRNEISRKIRRARETRKYSRTELYELRAKLKTELESN